MSNNRLLIGFYAHGLQFNGHTIQEKSLGGSETALLYMAKELAARGHDVKVFNNCDMPGRYDGVDYFDVRKSWNEIAPICEFDVFIVSRDYSFLAQKMNARMTILWNHDIATDRRAIMTNIWGTDFVWCLSQFHVDQWLSLVPEIKPILHQTRNGIDLELIDVARNKHKKTVRNMSKFIWGSRPERGLDVMLQKTWPRVLKEIDKDAQLIIAGYSDVGLTLPEHVIEYHKYLDTLIKSSSNVQRIGSLTKEQWYELLCTSGMMLYPTSFPEISCINALEAQACGLPIITSANFALVDTVADKNNLIQNNPKSDEYQNAMIARAKRLVSNDFEYKLSQRKGRNHVEGVYEWKTIAKEWEEFFWEKFEVRSLKNGGRNVIRNLIYKSDLVAAKWALDNADITGISINECEQVKTEVEGFLTKHHENPEEYAVGDSIDYTYWKNNGRFLAAARSVREHVKDSQFSLIDVGCGSGGFLAHVLTAFPNKVSVMGIDFSEKLIERTSILLKKNFPNIAQPSTFLLKADFMKMPELVEDDRADVVFAGEWLEHQIDLYIALEKLQSYAKVTGRIIVTVPNGPWEALSFRQNRERFHVNHFEFRDIEEIFGQKDFTMEFLPIQVCAIDGSLLGNWIISFSADPSKSFGRIDYLRKFRTTRPYQSISACMILKNEEDNLSKCLKSIRTQVDEIIIADTGSTDSTIEIAKKYADKVVSIDWTDDFSEARNKSIALANSDTDWIYWMDADEILVNQHKLRKYLNSDIFNGYVVTQNHLILDMPNVKPDVPVRVYRNGIGIKFYGCIHEHCEAALDKPIDPVLILPDVKIVHFGYITEAMRRDKCKNRNLELLKKDREKYPNRQLGIVLMMRDYLNVAQWELVASHGNFSDKIVQLLQEVVKLHRKCFANEKHLYHELSYTLYQRALISLGKNNVSGMDGTELVPFEVVFGLGGAVGGMAEPEKVHPASYWFLDRDEFTQFLALRTAMISDSLKLPESKKG